LRKGWDYCATLKRKAQPEDCDHIKNESAWNLPSVAVTVALVIVLIMVIVPMLF
jgi:hypothetical protein